MFFKMQAGVGSNTHFIQNTQHFYRTIYNMYNIILNALPVILKAFFCFLVWFWDRVLLYTLAWSGGYSVGQAGLKLMDIICTLPCEWTVGLNATPNPTILGYFCWNFSKVQICCCMALTTWVTILGLHKSIK